MKNISFDNPYLLLLAIPLVLLTVIPFFITRNKDNRSFPWTLSMLLHVVIALLITLAAAGMSTTSVLTKTTVYVLADVSHSSEDSLDKIDEYIAKISEELPEKTKLGIVCFAKNSVVITPAGRAVKSVREAALDVSSTDIAAALNYTETLFDGESLARIILITDGNDTAGNSPSSLASTVDRLTENGIKVDAIYLDNSLGEGDTELQISDAAFSPSAYVGADSEAKLLLRANGTLDVMIELYRKNADAADSEYKKIIETVITAESGFTTVKLALPCDKEGVYDYKAVAVSDKDRSPHNNEISFTQTVYGKTKVLFLTSDEREIGIFSSISGEGVEIDSFVVKGKGSTVPITIEQMVVYDRIVISGVDVRNIRNANAFIDSLDMAVSQYGKSLITIGDLGLQNNSDDAILNKFAELLPVEYGKTGIDGRLYTIVLDVSHSMFMASKFTIAKNAAIKLLSILEEDDYVCLVTFSGAIRVHQPKKVGVCKQELVSYIDGLSTEHGTDMAMGLEEALKTVRDLNLSENNVMIISDGFSFDSERSAIDVSRDLYGEGATVSAINTYIASDGEGGRIALQSVVSAGVGGKYYSISSPEHVEGIVFGDMADDVANAIIEKESTVNIVNSRDAVAHGLVSLGSISGYVLSVAKYDASTPLTVTYLKPNGYQETVPLYSYRAHGNGVCASFTSSVFDSWSNLWTDGERKLLLGNILDSTAPGERIDHPFDLNIDVGSYDAYLEIVPGVLDPSAKAEITIVFPMGRTIKRTLVFDSVKYFYQFALEGVGKYVVTVNYSYGDHKYAAARSFCIAYLPEYDAFSSFDKYNVYQFMRDNGETLVDEIPSFTHDKSEISTYKESFVIPLAFIASVLFVADISVRKIKRSKRAPHGAKEGK